MKMQYIVRRRIFALKTQKVKYFYIVLVERLHHRNHLQWKRMPHELREMESMSNSEFHHALEDDLLYCIITL